MTKKKEVEIKKDQKPEVKAKEHYRNLWAVYQKGLSNLSQLNSMVKAQNAQLMNLEGQLQGTAEAVGLNEQELQEEANKALQAPPAVQELVKKKG